MCRGDGGDGRDGIGRDSDGADAEEGLAAAE